MILINPNDPAMPQPIVVHENFNGVRATIEYEKAWADLSIRAELAARAMQGILANPVAITSIANNEQGDALKAAEQVAKNSVKFADALIAELNKPTPNE